MKRINYYRLYNRFQSLYTFFPYNFGKGRAFRPLRYNINLTFKCNLRCPFCSIGNQADYEELDTESWLDFINTIPFLSLISYSGGEVTLRPDFKTILKQSLRKAKVTFITNGTFTDDELIDIIVKERLFLLGVSIDGMNENHDNIRGVKGTFDRAITNIEKTQQRKNSSKYPLIDIKTVIINDNLRQLPEIYKLADSLKADFFTLSFLKGCNLQFGPILEDAFSERFFEEEYPIDKYFDMDTFEIVYRQLLAFSEESDTQFRFYPEFSSTRRESELETIKRFFEEGNSKRTQDIYQRCLYPWTEMSIISNGDCYPCLSYKTGNIKDAPILELWNNERMVEFRNKVKKHGVFNSCQGCCYSRIGNPFME